MIDLKQYLEKHNHPYSGELLEVIDRAITAEQQNTELNDAIKFATAKIEDYAESRANLRIVNEQLHQEVCDLKEQLEVVKGELEIKTNNLESLEFDKQKLISHIELLENDLSQANAKIAESQKQKAAYVLDWTYQEGNEDPELGGDLIFHQLDGKEYPRGTLFYAQPVITDKQERITEQDARNRSLIEKSPTETFCDNAEKLIREMMDKLNENRQPATDKQVAVPDEIRKKLEHVIDGLSNQIGIADLRNDDYDKGYLTAIRKEVSEILNELSAAPSNHSSSSSEVKGE